MPKKKKQIEFDSPHSGDKLILTEDEKGQLIHNWQRGKKKEEESDEETETLLDRLIGNFSNTEKEDEREDDTDN